MGVGGEGETLGASCRHSDDALPRKGLDLLRLPLGLLVAVAQLPPGSFAPAPDSAASGEGEAVAGCSRHAHGALTAQRRREAGQRVEPRHALAVAEKAWKLLLLVVLLLFLLLLALQCR